MSPVTDTPHPAAVRTQLDRLFEYERFRRAPTLRRILRSIVEQWLLDVRPELTERYIGEHLKDDDGKQNEEPTLDKHTGTMGYPKTKTNLHHVRGRLMTDYKEPEHSMDPVIITMEKGSYMPIIEFNRAAVRAPDLDEASKRLLLRVKTTLDGRTYAGAIRALDYFLRFVQSDSQHYQKWANLAFIPFATAPLVSYASHASTPLAQELIEQTRNAGFNPWECIFVEGCIKAARDHEWTQALKLFEAAEKGSQRESIYYWWHTALLASMGKIHDSIEILDAAVRHFSRRNIATRTDLAMLQIMYERYEDAEETLSSTLDFVSPGNPLVACSFAVLYEAQNRLNDAYVASNDWTDRIRAIPDPKNISYNEIIRVDWHSYLSGMLALVLGRSGATDYARDWLDTILERKAKNRVQPSVEIGIGLIGVNQFDDAVSWLTKAALEENDPMAMWFHIFPPLRHLRGHKGFEELLGRLNLPVHGER